MKPVRYGEVISSREEDSSMYKGVEGAIGEEVELRNLKVGFEDPSNVHPLGKRRR